MQGEENDPTKGNGDEVRSMLTDDTCAWNVAFFGLHSAAVIMKDG